MEKELNFETDQADWEYRNYPKEELQARYDSRASFYKKAYVIIYDEDEEILLLQSYNTIVAHIHKGKYVSYGKYSQTTSRHQKEFEKQFSY